MASCSSDGDCPGDAGAGDCCGQWGSCIVCPCSRKNPCDDGLCCSEWGHCNACPPVVEGSGFRYDAEHGEDSRLIAYVGNWQKCPADGVVDAYSHIIIAFAVSYTWAENKNICDENCNVAPVVPICEHDNQQDLVDSWRAGGKKVVLSFGGAGMGGNWSGDRNNCWDYCFGREDQLSTDLVNLVKKQNFDGIDVDYEYCYDVAGKQKHGRCGQVTDLYSDEKAQMFLRDLTAKLRIKLDQLQMQNGYDRGRYELTHAPMDTDLTPYEGEATKYFQILKERHTDLDFIMPQYYNGLTTPKQGLDTAWGDRVSAIDIFSALSNDLFENEPWKVVFGFCINVCQGSVNSEEVVRIMSELKTIRGGEFACNGGLFFWVAKEDKHGLWSDEAASEVSRTAGCSNSLIEQRPAKPDYTDQQSQSKPSENGADLEEPHLDTDQKSPSEPSDKDTHLGQQHLDTDQQSPSEPSDKEIHLGQQHLDTDQQSPNVPSDNSIHSEKPHLDTDRHNVHYLEHSQEKNWKESAGDGDGDMDLCDTLPKCRSLDVADILSCEVLCNMKLISHMSTSFWVTSEEESQSIGQSMLPNCGLGCVCIENQDSLIRGSEQRSEYACVHANRDEFLRNESTGKVPRMALGLILSFIIVSVVAVFFFLARKRRPPRKTVTTTTQRRGSLNQVTHIPQLTAGNTIYGDESTGTDPWFANPLFHRENDMSRL